MAIVIDSRYRGPEQSGNGGYTCGVIAREHGGAELEVTLLQPPPLDEWLRLEGGRVWDDHALIAEVREAQVELEPPPAVSWEEAVSAQAPDLASPFPECFVCGHAREDGLHIHAGPVEGRELVAAPWRVATDTIGPEFVWAALDCPGAYATGVPGRGVVVLARLTARVERVPQVDERCVVVGWRLESSGRKHGAGTALYSDSGELLGIARALWIEPRS